MKLNLVGNQNDRNYVMESETRGTINLVELLERFGKIMDYRTESMVASFYQVPQSTIENYGSRNTQELNNYGYRVYKKSEILNTQLEGLESIPNRGLRLYPIKAVIVIGMMLTESKIAEQLRQDIIDKLFNQQTMQISEKQMLQLKILNGDDMERILAFKEYEGVITKPLIETIEKQSDVIEEMKPAVVVKETLETSKDSILVGELSKILRQKGIDTGQNRLFEWMRNNGYLIKRKGSDHNMPTQKSMDLGLFEIKETNIVHSTGDVRTKKTTKVTGKGQVYFINKFIKPKEVI